VIASTIYLFPAGPQDRQTTLAALAMVVIPGLLMVSTIRFRSVKAIELGWQRSYFALFVLAIALALIASHPRVALVVLAYSYTLGALVMWVYAKARRRQDEAAASPIHEPPSPEPHPRPGDITL
jgi:phosphatidylserine synthase